MFLHMVMDYQQKKHESWCNRKNNWSPGTLKLTREKFRELGLHEKLHFANRKVDQQKGTFKGWVEVWLIAVDLCLCILKNHRKHKHQRWKQWMVDNNK